MRSPVLFQLNRFNDLVCLHKHHLLFPPPSLLFPRPQNHLPVAHSITEYHLQVHLQENSITKSYGFSLERSLICSFKMADGGASDERNSHRDGSSSYGGSGHGGR